MFDLSVVAAGGRWKLMDEAEGELGAFDSRAEALKAAAHFAVADGEPRHVLIQEEEGEWAEAVIEPPKLN